MSSREGIARNGLFSEEGMGRLWCLLLILLFGSVLYLTNLGAWDLWPSDEPRFGQIEREMLRSGDWLVPHLNNAVYTDKPPLFFWAGASVALLFNEGRVESWTTRLPSALSGIALLLVAFLLGERLFSRRAAFLGTLALAVTQKCIDQSRTAQTDMIMAIFAVSALAVFARAWFGGRRAWPAAIGFGLLTGLATLGKGPVGVIVPIGAIALFLALAREWRRIRWSMAILSFAVFALVVLAWLLPMVSAVSHGASRDLLWDQNITRYLQAEHHRRPPWYFVERLPVDFLPITLFLPAVAVVLWREARKKGALMRRERLFLLTWVVFTFVFFSVSAGKREQYILPLYPALALLVGDWMDRRIQDSPAAGRFFLATAWAVAATLLAGSLAALFGAKAVLSAITDRIEGGAVPPEWFSFPAIAAGIALAALAVAAGVWRRRLLGVFYGIVAGTSILWLTVFLLVYPPLNNRKSTRAFCETLNREWSPGESVFAYDLYRAQYHLFGDYYLDVVKDFAPIVEAFNGPGQAFCLMRGGKHYEKFQKSIGSARYYVLWEDAIGHRSVVLVSNRPPGNLKGDQDRGGAESNSPGGGA